MAECAGGACGRLRSLRAWSAGGREGLPHKLLLPTRSDIFTGVSRSAPRLNPRHASYCRTRT
eukprot:513491-Prymnesium_polylepis.1